MRRVRGLEKSYRATQIVRGEGERARRRSTREAAANRARFLTGFIGYFLRCGAVGGAAERTADTRDI